MHLRGALLRDGHIEYTIDYCYDPGVDLGAGERLQQLTGRLIMMATLVPGLATHADGNAWLRLVGPGLSTPPAPGTLRVAVDRLEPSAAWPSRRWRASAIPAARRSAWGASAPPGSSRSR